MPVSAVARSRPTERTIRFYVARGLVSAPEGRGTAATYGYRHLLQVLAVKLRQMEGATLDAIVREMTGPDGDAIERRTAAALGTRLPPPTRAGAGAGTRRRPRPGRTGPRCLARAAAGRREHRAVELSPDSGRARRRAARRRATPRAPPARRRRGADRRTPDLARRAAPPGLTAPGRSGRTAHRSDLVTPHSRRTSPWV